MVNTSNDWFAVPPAFVGIMGIIACTITPLIYLFILFCKRIRQSFLKSRLYLFTLTRNRSVYEELNTPPVLSDSSLF